VNSLKDRAAIAGIGATEFSSNSGRSELQLAVEATMAALTDAGLEPADVDGIVTYTLDNNPEVEVFRNIGGKALKFFSRSPYGGGGACAPILQAAMAVSTGVAEVVVCYRALNERSEYRFGTPMEFVKPTTEEVMHHYHTMHGLQTPAAIVGLAMRRYMHDTGATCEDFANVAISARRHAATNPRAFYYGRPLSRDEYMASKMIADPFRRFDCCMESDGSVAVVVTTTERARGLRQKPALIRAAAISATEGMVGIANYYAGHLLFDEVQFLARQLYASARLGPRDIQASIFYDHFGPVVMPTLEAFGFSKRGEAKDFIKNGNIEVGGAMPVNTNGGQVAEGYIHGMNGIAEAVRQVRGTAVNQVANVENVAVTAASGFPTSGLILSAV
jgi:acetyl-CoA acetyltransferase